MMGCIITLSAKIEKLCPEMSCTSHFGNKGRASNNQFYELLRNICYNFNKNKDASID